MAPPGTDPQLCEGRLGCCDLAPGFALFALEIALTETRVRQNSIVRMKPWARPRQRNWHDSSPTAANAQTSLLGPSGPAGSGPGYCRNQKWTFAEPTTQQQAWTQGPPSFASPNNNWHGAPNPPGMNPIGERLQQYLQGTLTLQSINLQNDFILAYSLCFGLPTYSFPCNKGSAQTPAMNLRGRSCQGTFNRMAHAFYLCAIAQPGTCTSRQQLYAKLQQTGATDMWGIANWNQEHFDSLYDAAANLQWWALNGPSISYSPFYADAWEPEENDVYLAYCGRSLPIGAITSYRQILEANYAVYPFTWLRLIRLPARTSTFPRELQRYCPTTATAPNLGTRIVIRVPAGMATSLRKPTSTFIQFDSDGPPFLSGSRGDPRDVETPFNLFDQWLLSPDTTPLEREAPETGIPPITIDAQTPNYYGTTWHVRVKPIENLNVRAPLTFCFTPFDEATCMPPQCDRYSPLNIQAQYVIVSQGQGRLETPTAESPDCCVCY